MKVIVWTFTHTWYDSSNNYYGHGATERTRSCKVVTDQYHTQEEAERLVEDELRQFARFVPRQEWTHVDRQETEVVSKRPIRKVGDIL